MTYFEKCLNFETELRKNIDHDFPCVSWSDYEAYNIVNMS